VDTSTHSFCCDYVRTLNAFGPVSKAHIAMPYSFFFECTSVSQVSIPRRQSPFAQGATQTYRLITPELLDCAPDMRASISADETHPLGIKMLLKQFNGMFWSPPRGNLTQPVVAKWKSAKGSEQRAASSGGGEREGRGRLTASEMPTRAWV
jgi:hypothetical protein